MLALHDSLDDLAHVALRGRHHVLRDLVGLELLVEVADATHLGDPLVDRDRAHLRGAGWDDPLPADTTVQDPGDLLKLARQDLRERGQAGHPETGEVDRVEQHPDAGPVDHVADRPGEHGNRDLLDELAPLKEGHRDRDLEGLRHSAVAMATGSRATPGRTYFTPLGRVAASGEPAHRREPLF